MSRERIIEEKKKYEKTYTDLMFAIDDLRQILDEEELRAKTFIKKVESLKGYMDFLDDLERESKKEKGFLVKLLKKEEDIDVKINNYLTKDRKNDIQKLQTCCVKCKVIHDIENKCMNHCLNCREKEYVYSTDKNNTLLTKSNDTVTLYQGDKEIIFDVAAWIIEKDNEGDIHRYCYLIDSKDRDNQHILRYSKFKGEEYYESVIKDDSQDELVRINNKFIEMGLSV